MTPARVVLAAFAFAALCPIAAAADTPPDPRVIWIEGEGEVSLNATGAENAHSLRPNIEKALPGWRVNSLQLQALHDPVPADAVYVLAGPRRDLTEEGEARLRLLIDGGARIMICINPLVEHEKSDLPRLRALLANLGIKTGVDRLLDPQNAPAVKPAPVQKGAPAARERAFLAARFLPAEHPLLRMIPGGTEILFADACRVEAGAGPKDPFETVEVFSTGADAFSEKATGGRGPAGPVAVAAIQRGGRGRILAVGDSTFLTDGFAVQTGRADCPLAAAAFRWLSEGIEGPKAIPSAPPAPAGSDPEVSDGHLKILAITALVLGVTLIAAGAVFGSRK